MSREVINKTFTTFFYEGHFLVASAIAV